MTANVAVRRGRRAADATAAGAPRRTVSTDSIRSVVALYVIYRSSLPSRRTSNDSRRSDVVLAEDQMDGPVPAIDNHTSTDLPRGFDHVVRQLCNEFERRYEQAS